MESSTKTAQVRANRVSPNYWRILLDNPPLNLMGPEFVLQFREAMTTLENDEQVRVVTWRPVCSAKSRHCNSRLLHKRTVVQGRCPELGPL
jgi:hypothetical protein